MNRNGARWRRTWPGTPNDGVYLIGGTTHGRTYLSSAGPEGVWLWVAYPNGSGRTPYRNGTAASRAEAKRAVEVAVEAERGAT